MIDAINQIFALFQVNYHNQYYSAFGDTTKSEDLAKNLWCKKLNHFTPFAICNAAEKIIAESDYLPTLNKMLNACRHVGLPANIPSKRAAYQEACNLPSPKSAQHWSHPIVYLSGRDVGWHLLANEIESKALPIFGDIYQQYCDRILIGENFVIESGGKAAELEELPATREHNQNQIQHLKELLN
tara:strand:- start:723 stop:1277 length:555 start_codon:yes stop_codon:yes gene_type:complete